MNNTIAVLEQYEAAAAELARVTRFTSERALWEKVGPTPPTYIKDANGQMVINPARQAERSAGTVWPEMDAVQAQLAALPAPPARDEAVAACVAHLGELAAEFAELGKHFVELMTAQLEAEIEQRAAELRQRYALAFPMLGLDTRDLPVQEAKAAFIRTEYAAKISSSRRTAILNLVSEKYPGASLDNQATWSAAAVRRVDAAFGESYEQQQLARFEQATGFSREQLARLVKTG